MATTPSTCPVATRRCNSAVPATRYSLGRQFGVDHRSVQSLYPLGDPPAGLDVIQNFGADRGNVIDLIGGAGGYTTAAAAYASLKQDGHGGSILLLGPTAHIDFASVAPQTLSVANFKIG